MNAELLLEQSKSKLARTIAPRHDESFQLEAVLDVIELYEAKTGDRAGVIELTVHGLECGRLAMEAYGDLFSEFYETLISVALRCCDELHEAPELLEAYRSRIDAIVSAASRVGYGYEYELHDVFSQLDWDREDDPDVEAV